MTIAAGPAHSLSTQDNDTAARQQLERVLASATFRQVDRLKRFLSFIVLEALARARRPAEGIRHRRAGLRQGRVVRSARRPDRPRPGAPPARASWSAITARKGAGDAVVIDLPKGGYAPVFKIRERRPAAGVRSQRRWSGQNTIARPAVRRPEPGARSRLLLRGPAPGDHPRPGQARRTARASRRRRGGPAAAGDGYDSRPRCMVTGGVRKVRAIGCVSTVHLVDTRHGVVPVVRIDRRGARRRLRGAGTRSRTPWSSKLEPRLLDAGQRRGAAGRRENLAARNLYLQGRYHLNQRTDEGLHKALEFFEKAIVEDAQFALGAQRARRRARPAARTTACGSRPWPGRRRRRARRPAVMLDGNSRRRRTRRSRT